MPLISFASPKGGVGKTTLTANVGAALQRLGWQVLVLDFDVQNSLRLHFAMPLSDGRGFAPELQRGEPWESLVFDTASGVMLLPFGTIDNEAARRFEMFLGQNPDWIEARVKPLRAEPDVLVLIDLPPGPSVYLDAMARIADLHIAVLLSDATSISVLPRIESGEFFRHSGGLGNGSKVRYVLNQVDIRRRLNRDVLTVLRSKLRERLIGVVYRDEALPEAIACQKLVAEFAPESKATYDIAQIARQIDGLLERAHHPASGAKVANR